MVVNLCVGVREALRQRGREVARGGVGWYREGIGKKRRRVGKGTESWTRMTRMD